MKFNDIPLFAAALIVSLLAFGPAYSQTETADSAVDGKAPSSKRLRDQLTLKTGGELQGRLASEKKDQGRLQVVWETPSGGFLKLDKSRIVRGLHKYDLIDQQYDRMAANMKSDSPDAHWEVIRWCEDPNRRARFRKEIVFHAKQIVRLDENDEKAKAKAGYEKFDNVWILKEHKFTNHGYEERTGGWVPTIFGQIFENEKELEGRQNERNIQFKKWKRNLNKSAPNVAANELKSITDEFTVGKIYDWLLKEKSFQRRLIGLDALGTVASTPAQRALIFFAIRDNNESVRDRAQILLKQKHYDPESITREITQNFMNVKLKKDISRSDVRAAGYLLGEIGTKSSILPLIEALHTTHKIANPDAQPPGAMNAGQGNDGNAGLKMGGGPKYLIIQSDNQTVLDALRKITGQSDMGFNESLWKQWYTEQNTIQYPNLRGDE